MFGTESTPTPEKNDPGTTAPSTDQAPPVQPTAPAPPVKAQKERAKAASIYLKSNDQVYTIPDQATLQRWVMERRVTADDLLSDGGESWAPAGERIELISFFEAVDKIDAYNELTAETVSDTTLESPMVLGAFPDVAEITEGVPTGLPPLPTEEHQFTDDVPTMAAEKQTTATPVPLDSIDLSSLDLPFSEEKPVDSATPDISVPPAAPDEEPVKQAQTLAAQLQEQMATQVPPPLAEEPFSDGVIPSAPSADEFASPEPEHTESAFDDEADLEPISEGNIDEFYSSFELEASDDGLDDDWSPAKPKPKPKMLMMLLTTVGAIAIGGAVYFFGFSGSPASNIQEAEQVAAAPEDIDNEPAVESAGLTPHLEEMAALDEALGIAEPPETAPETVKPDEQENEASTEPTEPATKATTLPTKAPAAPTPKPSAPKVSVTKTSEPKPKKKPKKSRPSGSEKTLVSQAWKAVDVDKLEDASRLFQSVLATSPRNAEANFGYGYVLMKQGSMSTAKTYLCTAKESAETGSSTESEVNGILNANGFSC